MNIYPEYRATGQKWLPNIPAHWDYRKLGSLFKERKSKVSDKEYMPLSVTKLGVVPQLANAAKTNDGDNRKLVCAGDFVINSRSDRKGSSGVSPLNGSISLINIVLVPRGDLIQKYTHYLMRSHAFIEEYYRNGRGIVADLWTTRYSEMKSSYLPVPPYEEQCQIAGYLDWQSSRINELINAKRKQITLLEEQKQTLIQKVVTKGLDGSVEQKDSGIEYIGEVPSHWLVLLNHRIYKEQSRKFSGDELVLSLSQKDGLLPYVDMKERSLHTSSYDNWKLVYPNDLVLNRFKAHLGVFFSSKYRGIVTFHYGVFEPTMKIASKYYEALYHTAEFKRIFASRSNGMTVGLQNLSNTNFYSVYTVYPPYEEQCAIVDEIERIEERYKALTQKIEQEIELLHEYRTRLISDVVTGQVDVRNITIPEYEVVDEITSDDEETDDEFVTSEVD